MTADASERDAALGGDDLIVSAGGDADAPGTLQRPTTLASALDRVAPGQTILLRGGTYRFSESIVIARENSGTASAPKTLAQFSREAPMLDFSTQPAGDAPGLSVAGSYWRIVGLILRGGAGGGIVVAGSHNRIERCATYDNRGDGLAIDADAATERAAWPSQNQIIHCESFDNHRDDPETDADGFAVRRAGRGNFFSGCVAHHNFGDGWDLSASADEAPFSTAIDQSVAHTNCTRTNGDQFAKATCSGFRLGSDGSAVPHAVTRSIAYYNDAYGFTAGDNPGAIRVSNALAFDNTLGNYAIESPAAVFTNDVSLWLEASSAVDDATAGEDVSGTNRFWRDGSSGVSTEDFESPLSRPRLVRGQSGELALEAFALAPSSDLIDAGVVPDGVLPFEAWYYKGKPDLGAFETR